MILGSLKTVFSSFSALKNVNIEIQIKREKNDERLVLIKILKRYFIVGAALLELIVKMKSGARVKVVSKDTKHTAQ